MTKQPIIHRSSLRILRGFVAAALVCFSLAVGLTVASGWEVQGVAPFLQKHCFDLLALQSDSTRTVTFQLSGMNAVPTIPGVKSDWHNLSHHGKDPAKIEELQVIEQAEFAAFNDFLTRLKGVEENGRPLLDHTAVLFGSNLGNASSHDWHNVPAIVAGGRFRHGSYVAHDEKSNTPLANLFVSLAQHMDLEIDRFGSSTAAGIRGLERATLIQSRKVIGHREPSPRQLSF